MLLFLSKDFFESLSLEPLFGIHFLLLFHPFFLPQGFCGSEITYCGLGCLGGPCLSPSAIIGVDGGICGNKTSTNANCNPGLCCSIYGVCGNSVYHVRKICSFLLLEIFRVVNLLIFLHWIQCGPSTCHNSCFDFNICSIKPLIQPPPPTLVPYGIEQSFCKIRWALIEGNLAFLLWRIDKLSNSSLDI